MGDGPLDHLADPVDTLILLLGRLARGSAKSVAGCLMFGVFGVLTGVRRGPAGTIGGV